MKREATKKENNRIHRKNIEHNTIHKEECSFYNWKARLTALLDFGKMIWPYPSITEKETFIKRTGYTPRSIKLKEVKKNDNK